MVLSVWAWWTWIPCVRAYRAAAGDGTHLVLLYVYALPSGPQLHVWCVRSELSRPGGVVGDRSSSWSVRGYAHQVGHLPLLLLADRGAQCVAYRGQCAAVGHLREAGLDRTRQVRHDGNRRPVHHSWILLCGWSLLEQLVSTFLAMGMLVAPNVKRVLALQSALHTNLTLPLFLTGHGMVELVGMSWTHSVAHTTMFLLLGSSAEVCNSRSLSIMGVRSASPFTWVTLTLAATSAP